MYYFQDSYGQQQGPVAANDLPQYGVTPQTNVWKEGMSAWQPAGSVGELSWIFAPYQAYAPPQPQYQQPLQPYNQYAPPRKSSASGWWIAGGVAAGLFFLLMFVGIAKDSGGTYYEGGTKFSNMTAGEQGRAIDDLTNRLDNYLIKIVKDDEQLMQFILVAAMSGDSDYSPFERKYGRDIERIGNEWAKAHNLNLNDDVLLNYLEYDFVVDYILHLYSLMMKDYSYY